ncbi:hypothetical protein NKH77_25725 [Streptomyces sp. M19]
MLRAMPWLVRAGAFVLVGIQIFRHSRQEPERLAVVVTGYVISAVAMLLYVWQESRSGRFANWYRDRGLSAGRLSRARTASSPRPFVPRRCCSACSPPPPGPPAPFRAAACSSPSPPSRPWRRTARRPCGRVGRWPVPGSWRSRSARCSGTRAAGSCWASRCWC